MAEQVLTLGVQGSKDVDAITKSLNSIKIALASLPPEIAKVSSSLKNLDKSLEAVGKEEDKTAASSKKLKSANESMFTSFLKANITMQAFNLALRALKAAFVDSIKSAAEFNSVFANVTTLVDTAIVNTDKMQKELLQLDNRLGSATELTKGLYQALSASIAPAEAVKFVGEAAKFAKAALTDTETAVDVLTTTLNAYGFATSEVTHVSDVFFQTIKLGKITGEQLASTLGTVIPLAANLDVSIEELGAAMAVFTKQGINAANAATRINATMTAFLKPSQSMIAALKKLGFESGSQAVKQLGGLKNAVDAIIQVTGLSKKELEGFQNEMIQIQKEAKNSQEETLLMEEAFERLKESTGASKDAIAELFPNVRALQGALTLTGEGAKDFENILDSITNTAGSTDEAFEKQKLTFAAMQNSLNKTAIAFGNVFIPILEDAAKVIESLSESFRGFIEDDSGAKLILLIGGIAVAIGIAIFAMGGLAAAGAAATAAFASIQAAVISLTVTMAANPFLLIIIAITALITLTAAYIISTNDLNKINKDLAKSTEQLTKASSEYKKVTAQLNTEAESLEATEKSLLIIRQRQLSLKIKESIQEISKAYGKINDTNIFGNSLLVKQKSKVADIENELVKWNAILIKINENGNRGLIVNNGIANEVFNIQQTSDKIHKLETKRKNIQDKIDESTGGVLKSAREIAQALIDGSIAEKDLLLIATKQEGLYAIIMEQRNALLKAAEEQKKQESKLTKENEKQIKLAFQQNENQKAYKKLLEDRASFIDDITKRLQEQNKTELELLNIREKEELETVTKLFKNHKDFEMRKNQVTSFFEGEKLAIIQKTNDEINKEFGKTAIEIEKAGQEELNILLRNGANKTKATSIIEDKIMSEKVKFGVATNNEMQKALQEFLIIKEQLDKKDFETFAEFSQLKQDADKQFQDNGLQSYLEYQLAIGEITQAQFDDIVGKQSDALATIQDNFNTLSTMARIAANSFVTEFDEAFGKIPGIMGDAAKQTFDVMSNVFDVLANKASTTGEKIMGGITAGLQAAGTLINTVFSAVQKENDNNISAIEERRVEEIEKLKETENTKVQIAQQALVDAQENMTEAQTIIDEERLLALEEYASHLVGLTDADIERALAKKELELMSADESKKTQSKEAIEKAKIDLAAAQKEEAQLKAKESQIRAIEDKAAAEKRALQIKQFNEEKALAIAQIWIAAGIATMGAWAGSMALGMPAGAIVAAVMSATILGMAIAQTAIVASQAPGFAGGVSDFGGGMAVVGEEGPELVTLGRGANVVTNENTNKILKGINSGVADDVDNRDFITVANIYLDGELVEQRTITNRRFSENRIGVQ